MDARVPDCQCVISQIVLSQCDLVWAGGPPSTVGSFFSAIREIIMHWIRESSMRPRYGAGDCECNHRRKRGKMRSSFRGRMKEHGKSSRIAILPWVFPDWTRHLSLGESDSVPLLGSQYGVFAERSLAPRNARPVSGGCPREIPLEFVHSPEFIHELRGRPGRWGHPEKLD